MNVYFKHEYFHFSQLLIDGLDSCRLLVTLNFSKSVPMNKQGHLHLGWPEGELFCTFSVCSEWIIPLMWDTMRKLAFGFKFRWLIDRRCSWQPINNCTERTVVASQVYSCCKLTCIKHSLGLVYFYILIKLGSLSQWFHEETLASMEPFHSTKGGKRFLDSMRMWAT